MADANKSTSTQVGLISREELSTRLNVSPSTTRRLEKANVIQGIRVGGQVRYQWNEVLGALKKGGAK